MTEPIIESAEDLVWLAVPAAVFSEAVEDAVKSRSWSF